MGQFNFKSHPQLVAAGVAKLSAETGISDFTNGSVALTLIELAAQEDFQQYVQMLNIIRNYNLDTTEGEDLDRRAAEYGLTRKQPSPHSGFVTIIDTRFTKISTKIYAGLPGPTATSTILFVDDASSFPATGQVYIGRGTTNSEGPIAYSAAPVNFTSYWAITLDTALINDHGTDETIILAQFGSRVINAGTEVQIPENDFSEQVLFELNQTIELLDGEHEIDNILVTALNPGATRVPSNSIVVFPNEPFSGASVSNPLPFVNGRDQETDQELRDRIRNTIQSLSRGTSQSVKNGIIGLIDSDTNQSVVSASIVAPVILADGPTKVFIDNGRGLEPSLASTGLETIISQATGGEQFFQLENFPVLKANLVTQNIEPFALVGLENLNIRVGTNEETFTFQASDFQLPGTAKATEIAQAINNRSSLLEARTITDALGKKVIINPKANQNEDLQIDSSSTANTALNFNTDEVATLKLYKNDKLLTKDGLTASLLSAAQPFNMSATSVTTTDGDIIVTPGSAIVTKSVAGLNPFTKLINKGDYIKFSADADIFYVKVRTVVSDTKLILESIYPISGGGTGNLVIWNSMQLEIAANGDRDETEIISFGPNDFANPAQALASEVFARIDAELNLSKVELAVNSTKIKIISHIEDSAESKIQILGGHAAISLGFSSSQLITGTITVVGGSKVVSGVGTLFTSELQEGQWIRVSTDGTGTWTKIETIENDTTLYLTEGYRGGNFTTQPAQVLNFSELAEGKNKDYVLNRSNGQLELLSPLAAGDSLTAGSINTRAFSDGLSETYDFDALGASSTLIVCVDGGFSSTITTGDGSAPYDTFIDTGLIGFPTNFFTGFYLEWISGNNKGETSFVASYNNGTGQLSTTSGFTNPVVASDKLILCQVINFTHASDFGDPQNATAAEVIAAVNSQLLGGKAEVLADNSVRIRTSNFGPDGKIQIKGGSANAVLGFLLDESSNQLTNLAFIKSGNSDRKGNTVAPGYTLGPSQKLIAILDEDSANKTFSINMDIKEAATAAGVGTFSCGPLGAKYLTTNYFKDFFVYWLSGALEGSVQNVTGYVGVTGVFTTSDVFPSGLGSAGVGDQFALVPRTAENIVAHMNDLNVTTFSIEGTSEVTGITGDFIQLSTKTPGSEGKMFITGGTANSLGIAIQTIPAGSPVNDVEVNSIAGLTKGLIVSLTADGKVTTGDNVAPYDTFIDTSMITPFASYFNSMEIEFLTGLNAGHKTTISSYNNVTGQIVLTAGTANAISINDTFRITKVAFIVDIQGTTAPYTLQLNDAANVAIDVSAFTSERSAAIRDRNGLHFENIQIEGVDGYKNASGLIQKVQWTIDGLDRDITNYPGIGAAGTQFEVLPPVLVKVKLILNVTTEEGISLSSISGEVANVISGYINSLGVGQDVILSEIIAASQSVSGVFDVEILNLTNNIVVADGELARIDSADLVVG